jgi:hypothetical protein
VFFFFFFFFFWSLINLHYLALSAEQQGNPTPHASPYFSASSNLKSGQLYTPVATPLPFDHPSLKVPTIPNPPQAMANSAACVPTPISSPLHKGLPVISGPGYQHPQQLRMDAQHSDATESLPSLSPRSMASDMAAAVIMANGVEDPRKLVRQMFLGDDAVEKPKQEEMAVVASTEVVAAADASMTVEVAKSPVIIPINNRRRFSVAFEEVVREEQEANDHDEDVGEEGEEEFDDDADDEYVEVMDSPKTLKAKVGSSSSRVPMLPPKKKMMLALSNGQYAGQFGQKSFPLANSPKGKTSANKSSPRSPRDIEAATGFFSVSDESAITSSFARRASVCSTTSVSSFTKKRRMSTCQSSDGEASENSQAGSNGGSSSQSGAYGFSKTVTNKKPTLPKEVDMTVYRDTANAPVLTWPKGGPMSFGSDTPMMDSLTKEELVLCKTLRLFPMQYLQIKETVVGATYTRPPFKKKELRMWFPIDVNKLNKLYDWFLAIDWIPNDPKEWDRRAAWYKQQVIANGNNNNSNNSAIVTPAAPVSPMSLPEVSVSANTDVISAENTAVFPTSMESAPFVVSPSA